jgi:uncharacterized Ntn-hydrolase superfamily protein
MTSTYSITACDLERRQWGVAVESKFLAIGAVVPWAEAGVGAIATQAWINVSYGQDGLRLLRDGHSAQETVEVLVANDEQRDLRQLGVIDAAGRAASHTGAGCVEWAGSRAGPGYTAQGNMLVSAATIDAMARAFEEADDAPLGERLLAALVAGQAAGGDRRGRQASALYVVERGGGYGASDIAVDLRVDDDCDPIGELQRLYALHKLYFGKTPREQWLPVDEPLRAELRDRLSRLGYASGDLASDLEAWAGVENLEERVEGVARIDPVVLAELRKR